jgi:hypothetical protein
MKLHCISPSDMAYILSIKDPFAAEECYPVSWALGLIRLATARRSAK